MYHVVYAVNNVVDTVDNVVGFYNASAIDDFAYSSSDKYPNCFNHVQVPVILSSVSAIQSPQASTGRGVRGMSKRASPYEMQPASPPAVIFTHPLIAGLIATIAQSIAALLNPVEGVFHGVSFGFFLAFIFFNLPESDYG